MTESARVIKITPKAYALIKFIQLMEDEILSSEAMIDVVNRDLAEKNISANNIQEMLRRIMPISHQTELSSLNPGEDSFEGLNLTRIAMDLSNELTEYIKRNYFGDSYSQIVASLNKGDMATQRKLEKLLEAVAQLMDCGHSFEDITIFFIPANITSEQGVRQSLCEGWHDFIENIFAGTLQYETLLDDRFRQGENPNDLLEDPKIVMMGGAEVRLNGILAHTQGLRSFPR